MKLLEVSFEVRDFRDHQTSDAAIDVLLDNVREEVQDVVQAIEDKYGVVLVAKEID